MKQNPMFQVMGQTQSSDGGPRGALESVFPIDFAQDRNLDKLSMVAARILNTPDIYDINNLSRPGVCGDYAVFLKKELTKKLLPFTVSLPDEKGNPVRTEVVYQSAQASANDATRKLVCGEMVDTMLRVVAVVLACLSSMQVAGPSRPRTLKVLQSGAPTQKGGAPIDVYRWLVTNGVIESSPNPIPDGANFTGDQVRLRRTTPQLSNYKFSVLFEGKRANAVDGAFMVEEGTGTPTGGFRFVMLDPITVTTGGVTSAISILPLRIKDALGATWAAGAIIKPPTSEPIFKSFWSTTPEIYLDELLYHLFNRVRGVETGRIEKRTESDGAAALFNELKQTRNSASVLSALQPVLARYFPGYTPAQPPAIPGYGAGFFPGAAAGFPAAPGFPGAAPIQQPAYPYGAVPQQGPVAQPRPLPYGLPPAIRPGLFVPPTAPGYYHIPLFATNNIRELFKTYANIIPTESTPAVVRAYALRGTMDPNTRKFRPAVCADEYWNKKDLSYITPWATFQFLSTKNWEKLTGQTDVPMEDEWVSFIRELESIYNGTGCPKFVVPASGMKLLKFMSFTGIKNTKLCEKEDTPFVGFRKVQDGVLRLQGLYAEHTKRVWVILNSLISLIRDPDRKIEVVRLNDAVLRAPSSSQYVKERAAEARRALLDYYTAVERTYVDVIKSIGEDLSSAK